MSDPLDELRAAWQQDRPEPPGAELEAADRETQRAVEWLRQAYRAQPPATSAALLERLQRRRARRPRLRRVAAPFALAAAAVLVWLVLPAADPPTAPSDTRLARRPPPAQPPAAEPAPALFVPPERFRSRPDGIELTAGKVRLVLVRPLVEPPTGELDDNPSQDVLR